MKIKDFSIYYNWLESMSIPKISFLIFSISLFVFLPFLGKTHLFDWDEINFAECAREMIVSGDIFTVQIDFKPFWEKPPLFIWFQVLSMKAFGVNEFAARFPNAMCGAFTLTTVFIIGAKLKNIQFGLLFTLCFVGSILPQFYFHSGIIDPYFNLFIFSSLTLIFLFIFKDRNYYYLLFSALFLGFSVLTKGPVAFLIVGGVLFGLCMLNFRLFLINWYHLLIWGLASLAVGSSWFVWLFLSGKEAVIQEFIAYQIRLFSQSEAGHGQPWFYHSIVLFIGCFPISMIAILAIFSFSREIFQTKLTKDYSQEIIFSAYSQLMLVLFVFVLVLFSCVTTKIVHYSSLCYFPITFFAARGLSLGLAKNRLVAIITFIQTIFITILLFAIPILGMYIESNYDSVFFSKFIKDEFVIENLKAIVGWSFVDLFPGLLMIAGGIIFIFLYKSKKTSQGYLSILVINAFMLLCALPLLVPKIERITQGSVIDFLISKNNSNVEIITKGFKSYAHYFYADKNLDSKTDTIYLSKSTSKSQLLQENPNFSVIWEKNGFVAYE